MAAGRGRGRTGHVQPAAGLTFGGGVQHSGEHEGASEWNLARGEALSAEDVGEQQGVEGDALAADGVCGNARRSAAGRWREAPIRGPIAGGSRSAELEPPGGVAGQCKQRRIRFEEWGRAIVEALDEEGELLPAVFGGREVGTQIDEGDRGCVTEPASMRAAFPTAGECNQTAGPRQDRAPTTTSVRWAPPTKDNNLLHGKAL